MNAKLTKKFGTKLVKRIAVTIGIAAAIVASPTLVNAQNEASLNPSHFNVDAPQGVELSHGNWIRFRSEADKTIESSFVLKNPNDMAVEFAIAAVDGRELAQGGIGFTPLQSRGPEQEPIPGAISKTGTWINVEPRVVLNPNETRNIPFTVKVPASAPQGVSLGGIAVWAPQRSTKPTREGQENQLNLTTQTYFRRVLGVEIITPGPLDPQVRINGVSAIVGQSGLALSMDIANLGTDYASGEGRIEVAEGNFAKDFKLGEVIPGEQFPYSIDWTSDAPAGEYNAKIRISYGDNRVATWTGKFSVDQDMANRAKDRAELVEETKSTNWTLWILIVIGSLVILGFVVFMIRRALMNRFVDNLDRQDAIWADNPLLASVDIDAGPARYDGLGRFDEAEMVQANMAEKEGKDSPEL